MASAGDAAVAVDGAATLVGGVADHSQGEMVDDLSWHGSSHGVFVIGQPFNSMNRLGSGSTQTDIKPYAGMSGGKVCHVPVVVENQFGEVKASSCPAGVKGIGRGGGPCMATSKTLIVELAKAPCGTHHQR